MISQNNNQGRTEQKHGESGRQKIRRGRGDWMTGREPGQMGRQVGRKKQVDR